MTSAERAEADRAAWLEDVASRHKPLNASQIALVRRVFGDARRESGAA